MYPEDIDPESGCRLPLPRREELDDAGQRIYDSLADPKGGTIRGLRGPGGIMLHSPELSRHARPLNRYLRHEAGLGGRVRELAILTTARELDSQFEWAAHEPEALGEGVSREIIEVIKHRKDTSGLGEADAIVIELGREIFGWRRVTSATFARSLQQFGRRALVDPRGPHGQLCRDSSTSRRLRHAARSQSAAALAAAMRRSSAPTA
jgi:4-carboxymuconolactone decarboxylase